MLQVVAHLENPVLWLVYGVFCVSISKKARIATLQALV